MDVYDEVDRRETDAGKFRGIFLLLLMTHLTLFFFCNSYCFHFSVASYTKSQHSCVRDNCGAFSSCKSRIFLN